MATNPSEGGGGGAATGLGNATAAVIVGQRICPHNEDRHVIVFVASTGSFKIDYMSTPDNGTSWYVGKTVSDATVVVDGGVALYVSSGVLDTPVGRNYKVQIWNDSGGNIDYAYD